MLPTLFLSHGSPMTVLTDTPGHRFLAGLGAAVPRPKAILMASAHWLTIGPALSAPAANETIHDFSGFPPPLYACRYPAPPAPDLARRAAGLLDDAGLGAAIDPRRGLDHGAWVPLLLAWPKADIPVAQLAIQPRRDPAHHLAVGRALAPLAQEGVLVIGSGSFTHNLGRIRREAAGATDAPDVAAFSEWMDAALEQGRTEDLLAYRTRAPYAAEQHPTDEHLLPLYVALGAAGEGAKAERLHASVDYGVLRMDAFAFRQ
ncbi:MAG: dioxygenase [Rhodospirillales bacterium]|jgi:4,5-DOPA dioxygenase extradiol|nr:dioxygenase [Rhodospirillales bacterium]